MHSERRIVPSWMRTTAKIGLVMFLTLAGATALAHNWPLSIGMMVFALMQIALLITTQSKS